MVGNLLPHHLIEITFFFLVPFFFNNMPCKFNFSDVIVARIKRGLLFLCDPFPTPSRSQWCVTRVVSSLQIYFSGWLQGEDEQTFPEVL